MAPSGLSPQHRREIGTTGIMVSPLGFGASPLGNEFGAIDVRRLALAPLLSLLAFPSAQP
jgi:hypothetical protein